MEINWVSRGQDHELKEMLLLLFHFFNNNETIITEKQSLCKAIKPPAS